MKQNSVMNLKKRRMLWIDCLNGDDCNSVVQQIFRMLWNAAVFRVVNECRRMSPQADEADSVQVNGMIHELIDQCFLETQALAIRRLTDNSYSIDGHNKGRDVYSLSSLLKDMLKHQCWLTRKGIFDAEGLEYDLDAVEKKESTFFRDAIGKGVPTGWVPNTIDSLGIRERHNHLDVLTATNANGRSPNDLIQQCIIESLRENLKRTCDEVNQYANKFIAHSATPGSRQIVGADDIKITLKCLWDSHRTICEATNFIGEYFLGIGGHAFLPHAVYDQFVYMERPLVTGENLGTLRKLWNAYEEETRSWSINVTDFCLAGNKKRR